MFLDNFVIARHEAILQRWVKAIIQVDATFF